MAKKISALLKEASRTVARIDGRAEAAMALAASVKGFAFDQAKSIPWEQPLSSARFGLRKSSDIRRFKQNLVRVVPQAADWIDSAPISAANTLAAVADLVATAMRNAARQSQAATYAIPAIVVKGELSESRQKVANILGKDFAGKASDRFIYRAGLRMKTAPAADVATDPTALVLEFQDGYESLPEPSVPAMRAPRHSEVAALLDAAIRGKEIAEVRGRFYANVTTMRADLEKSAGGGVRTREAGAERPQTTQVCWLNGTMQVLAKPRDVAYCASEQRVQRIGLPRLIEREMDVTVAAIGVIAFRAANHFDGAGIQVAVIDGECDAAHPALAGRIVHKNNFTSEPWGIPDRHGTTVAGILCSTHSILGGICPAATVLNYKVLTTDPRLQGTDFQATLAIQSAVEDGARVINMSWGLGLATNGESREARAVNRAWRLGSVMVKSAGNRGPQPGTLTSPADASDVIVVGATNRNGTAIEPYSSRGPNGARSGPDVLAPGANPASQLQGLLLAGATGSAGFGTSFAAPHVSGLIAVLLQQNPALKPNDVRLLLVAKSTVVGTAPPSAQGFGFVKI